MAVWVVRGAKGGTHEQRMLDHNIASIGFETLPDMSKIKSQEEMQELYSRVHPEAKHRRMIAHSAILWNFVGRMDKGDLVVLPMKTQAAIAIGKVIGKYEYTKEYGDDLRHVRKVKWLNTDMPRTVFDQDLLNSFGAYLTVGRVKAENAEARIKAILAGSRIPTKEVEAGEIPEKQIYDVEQSARDQIVKYIEQNFSGHALAELIEEILRAQGYVTKRSDPGPDGGVDILAGSGPMGFESPKLCVQVKSGLFQADVVVLRNLQGVMNNFEATQGLLVCWGGFKRSVTQEARRKYFTIRLWDSGDIINNIFKYYDKLTDTMQATLPLKRLWALAIEEEA
jgi:restriction system protein